MKQPELHALKVLVLTPEVLVLTPEVMWQTQMEEAQIGTVQPCPRMK